jgi:hypothetical protein
MVLDKEAFAMRTPISRSVWPETTSTRHRKTGVLRACEDTPYSPYLRSWIAHRAAQHRDLLRNIDAAVHLGLGAR